MRQVSPARSFFDRHVVPMLKRKFSRRWKKYLAYFATYKKGLKLKFRKNLSDSQFQELRDALFARAASIGIRLGCHSASKTIYINSQTA